MNDIRIHSPADVQQSCYTTNYVAAFNNITDTLKVAAFVMGSVGLSEEATKVLQNTNNIQSLQTDQYYFEYYTLAGAVYTNWDCTPYDANRGSYHEFREMMYEHENADLWAAIDEDVQYWKSTRVFDHYMVLFDRDDGTVVVSSDLKRVYLVVGCNKERTLGYEANLSIDVKKKIMIPNASFLPPKFYSPVMGTRLALTLVNWKGKITHDGIIRGIDKGTPMHVKYALRAYKKALEKNTIISTLEKKTPTPYNVIRANPTIPKEVLQEYWDKLANEFNLIANFLHRSNPKKDLPWIFINEG
jgi:hypothetical protein